MLRVVSSNVLRVSVRNRPRLLTYSYEIADTIPYIMHFLASGTKFGVEIYGTEDTFEGIVYLCHIYPPIVVLWRIFVISDGNLDAGECQEWIIPIWTSLWREII